MKLLVGLKLLGLSFMICLLIPQCKIKMPRITLLETFRSLSVTTDPYTMVAINCLDLIAYNNQNLCHVRPDYHKFAGQR